MTLPTGDHLPEADAHVSVPALPELAPKPTPAELLGKWIYYRQHRLGWRIQKGFVQTVRGSLILEISGSPLVTGYPLYLPHSEIEVILSQTVEEDAAERAKADPGPSSPHSLITRPQ